MTTRLIVNADDFGLTRGINRAIVELHEEGAITSATLMARGPAFDHAVEMARLYPGLGLGCHVVLTDGVPVSPPASIPSLLGADRVHFRPQLKDFVIALVLGRIRTEELEAEIIAQIEKIQGAGLPVTHLDTHKHTHVFTPVARALLRAAERKGVRAVRNPFEGLPNLRLGHSSILRWLAVAGVRPLRRVFLNLPQIRNGTVCTTSGTLGISATGHLDRNSLRTLLDSLPEGTWELVCHPGYRDADLDVVKTRLRTEREIEREALAGELTGNSSHLRSVELIHYGRLAELSAEHPAELPAQRTPNPRSENPR